MSQARSQQGRETRIKGIKKKVLVDSRQRWWQGYITGGREAGFQALRGGKRPGAVRSSAQVTGPR